LSCQYDLRGLKSGVCPECGRGFDPADQRTFDSDEFRELKARVCGRVALGLASMPLVMAAVLQAARVVWRIQHGRWPVAYEDDPGGEWWAWPFVILMPLGIAGTVVAIPVVTGCVAYVVALTGKRGLWLWLWCAVLGGGGLWLLWMDFFRASAWFFD